MARNGLCCGNTVLRARSSYGGGYGAGIYIDGARSILVEDNTVAECDLGIEVGAENKGALATGIVVRGNTLRDNDKAGLACGGFSASKSGRVEGCTFSNNTLTTNTRAGEKAQAEVWVQAAGGNTFTGNRIAGEGGERPLLMVEKMAGENVFDGNAWSSPDGAAGSVFLWKGKWCEGIEAYRAASGQGGGDRFVEGEISATEAEEPKP